MEAWDSGKVSKSTVPASGQLLLFPVPDEPARYQEQLYQCNEFRYHTLLQTGTACAAHKPSRAEEAALWFHSAQHPDYHLQHTPIPVELFVLVDRFASRACNWG